MMIHAYQETYLDRAQSKLGDIFDYAINICNMPGEEFVKEFSVSHVCQELEVGNPAYIAGRSGIELLNDILYETKGEQANIVAVERFGRSKEYWIGKVLAYYQWYSGRRFAEIFEVVKYDDFDKMYYTLHEADITKTCDVIDVKMSQHMTETRLKRIRAYYGCSQSQLAKKSGVSLRSIQMYEQRNKDINKASVETVLRLAKALGCSMESLLE